MIIQCEVVVEYDKCGDEEKFEVATPNQSFGPDQLKHALRGNSWDLRHTPHGIEMVCPDCNEDE